MTLILFIITFGLGCGLFVWGNTYRQRGRRFPSRYGGTTSPWQIMACGGMLLVLSFFVLAFGI
ncbi:hypothetical protein [uncultured Hyphomicrobium sp.]|uniref:hypothetical protein n=1 Tax=uncultured Hyphomicrobium sp. TaxID=194373 RepID=UPI0025CEE37A|nr:hypothetical protein [uncultured Hyphomicrobium sp.]